MIALLKISRLGELELLIIFTEVKISSIFIGPLFSKNGLIIDKLYYQNFKDLFINNYY